MKNRRQAPTATSGFTVLEMLLVVAILGIMLTVGIVQLRPPNARLFSNDLKSQVQQARYEAVKRNRPVAVVWEPDEARFVTRFDETSTLVGATCSGSTVLLVRRLAEYRGITINTDMPENGLVWLPTGQGRDCSGSPAIDSTTTVDDGRSALALHISSGGKVSLE